MTGVRANWFLDELPRLGAAEDDPFADVEAQRVEDVGVEIDLRGDTEQRLAQVIEIEGRVRDDGITCAVRERPDTSCSACPFSRHEQPDSRLHRLCLVGREKERLISYLAHAWEIKRGS